MATYAIGDIQGCAATLQALLDLIRFDPDKDELWLVGDLVNRGPSSLQVLRLLKGFGSKVVSVLGNHDLYLLARAAKAVSARASDTLDSVLTAPDAPELLKWLSLRPLLYRRGEFVLVHAGLLPEWSIETAEFLAREAEEVLQGSQAPELLRTIAGKQGTLPPPGRLGVLAHALRVFTKIRTCTPRGELCTGFSGPPSQAPFPCRPWFDIPGRRNEGHTIVFGHWSALGCLIQPGIISLDTGCNWGGTLTAVRLEDRAKFEVALVDAP